MRIHPHMIETRTGKRVRKKDLRLICRAAMKYGSRFKSDWVKADSWLEDHEIFLPETTVKTLVNEVTV